MVESKKAKIMRLMLVIFFVSFTAFGFFLKYDEKVPRTQAGAIVIEKSQGENDNPEVIMYEYKHNRYVLARYEIERTNKFHFRTIAAIELSEPVQKLQYDQAGNGFWVEISDGWHYFNYALLEEREAAQGKISSAKVQFVEETTNEGNWLLIEGRHKVEIGKDEYVVEIHSLSLDNSLWMMITNQGVKIVSG
ncbi:hypothetical protein [Bacillus dakarensis]|uniref:hypothetical protein n=1 Tax=Robertmurraya dakarensis TaxID=1926278 RepID=UPI000981947A|nr:hypothetical protein [Bacillus dakarensis]